MTPADELRTAAALLRRAVDTAALPVWDRPLNTRYKDTAATRSDIGTALADLLEAVSYDPDDETLHEPGSARHGGCDRTVCPAAAALAVARAINGSQQ